MKPGHNGGGNPNHDENGRFTSNGNASSGREDNSEEKQAMELFNLKGSEKKDKYYAQNSEGELLDEEGFEAKDEQDAYEQASKKYPGMGDELSVNKEESNNNDNDEEKEAMNLMGLKGSENPQKPAKKEAPKTYQQASDLYDKENYTGPGYDYLASLPPMANPNHFSEKFPEDFLSYISPSGERIGQKFFEDRDYDVWDNLRDAENEVGNNATVKDVAEYAAKKYGGSVDQYINAMIFEHIYNGHNFRFSPETNYKKLKEKQSKEYKRKYLDYYSY